MHWYYWVAIVAAAGWLAAFLFFRYMERDAQFEVDRTQGRRSPDGVPYRKYGEAD